MRFQIRWHMFRKQIFVLEKEGKDFRVTGLQRRIYKNGSNEVVRLNGMICVLHSEAELKRFFWKKVGLFGRKRVREDAPKFLMGGNIAQERDLNRPAVYKWEEPIGAYS